MVKKHKQTKLEAKLKLYSAAVINHFIFDAAQNTMSCGTCSKNGVSSAGCDVNACSHLNCTSDIFIIMQSHKFQVSKFHQTTFGIEYVGVG